MAVVILTVMITPIMIAIITDALYSVPTGWKEGAVALGVNRWRAMWTVSVRAARPAIIAAAVLATARALGEGIMLSMVSGGRGFSPNPLDGITALFEPLRPLASTIVENVESLNAPAIRSSVYTFALLLLFSELRPVGRRLSRQAADEEIRDPRLMALSTPPRFEGSIGLGPMRPARRRRNDSLKSWRWGDRLVLRLLGLRHLAVLSSPRRSSA